MTHTAPTHYALNGFMAIATSKTKMFAKNGYVRGFRQRLSPVPVVKVAHHHLHGRTFGGRMVAYCGCCPCPLKIVL